MENLQINETEIKTIDAVVTDLETRISRLVVNSQENLTIGGDILAEIKMEIKQTDEKRKTFTQPLLDLKKKWDDIFNPRIKAFEKLKGVLEDNMRPYQLKLIKEKEAAAAEAQERKVAELEERKNQAITAAAETGSEIMVDVAADIEDYQGEIAEREIKGHSRTTGGMGQMTARKVWRAKIVNAVIIPRSFCVPDEKLLNEYAKVHKENAKIDGVEFYEDVINTNR